ncbi:zinc-binding dehydrogenase [Streptomyces lincolnensis]|uniref:zinc-binding dehydrogenase n=1 Tax=Streptomyces lincolnensis TaxID=1915 RepID=UPI001E2B0FC6|nr:zinc-binding dehydrogenase [Streptomyces lincolnensis]MCD7439437.1 zinc-binding dehydrogenase [Streptomyces lincolnensis]
MRGFVTDATVPGGLRLTDGLPEPAPAPHEAVVEVRAFSLNHDEANLIRRRPHGWRPGQDTAGVVVRAAADGTGPREGTRVVAYMDWEGWCERIPIAGHRTAVLPDEVSFEQAATLPVAGLTALRALRVGGALLGRNVLVTGASGGVGQFAVQLAVASGARVTAHVTRPERAAEVRALGAHHVVTSLAENAENAEGGEGGGVFGPPGPSEPSDSYRPSGPFHLALDGIGGPLLPQVMHRMAPGATTVLYGNIGGPAEVRILDFAGYAPNSRLMGLVSPIPDETKGEDLAILVALIADGRLTPRIGLRDTWDRTPEAFAALAARAFRGKAVLVLP